MKRLILILAVLVIALALFNRFANPQRNAEVKPTTNTAISRPTFHPSPRTVHAAQIDSTNSVSADDAEDAPKKLSREQIEAYLLKTKRSPESLLNAFWEIGDTNFLAEAIEKYPDNPMVQWAKLNTLSPEERGPWLEKLKTSAPDNALPNYLSALDNLKSGNVEKGLAEMDLASQKKYSAFEKEQTQSREEMYLFSGCSPVEAREAGMFGILLPNLREMKQLASQIDELQKKYIAAGDPNSAQQLAMLSIEAGRKTCQPNSTVINTLVGSAMEQIALKNLNENTSYEFLGETPGQRLQELKDQKQEIKTLMSSLKIYPDLPVTEKLIYWDRMKLYGELEAMRWFQRTYGETNK